MDGHCIVCHNLFGQTYNDGYQSSQATMVDLHKFNAITTIAVSVLAPTSYHGSDKVDSQWAQCA